MINQQTLLLFKQQAKIDERRVLIKSSLGFKIWSEILHSRMSYLIFLENNRTMRLCITHLNTTDLFAVPDEVRWKKQRKLVTAAYNVISSATSFKDHLNYRNRYNSSSGEIIVVRFFKLLRNFLIHNDTFSLTSRKEWNIDKGIKVYQAMDKKTFLDYLVTTHRENLPKNDGQAKKYQKQLQDTITFVESLPELFDFEPLYKNFVADINLYHHQWIKHKVKKNIAVLTEFAKQVEEHHKEETSILIKIQLRYLKLLLNKKHWKAPKFL